MAERPKITAAQKRYLSRGLGQAGGKLPLFDVDGQRFPEKTIRACLRHGWAAPWYRNPIKPDWLVCRLTAAGKEALESAGVGTSDGSESFDMDRVPV